MTAAPAAKAALHDGCVSIYADCQVTYGHPGTLQEEDIVAVGDITAEQSTASMNAASRPREERFTITVWVSVWRGGGPDVQRGVTERAYELAGRLGAHLRTADPTLDGSVISAAVTGLDMAEDWIPARLAKGRTTEITVTVSCLARI